MIACQQAASESILKWSLHEENRAIRDVAFQLNELAGISAFVQEQFCRNISESTKQLEYLAGGIVAQFSMEIYSWYLLVEGNKQLLQANKEAVCVASKESKIRKEISSPSQWKKGGDIRLLESQLAQTARLREMAERKLEVFHFLIFSSCQSALEKSCPSRLIAFSGVTGGVWDSQNDSV